eukprot:4732160-Pyramimonas_sp.AAC.1
MRASTAKPKPSCDGRGSSSQLTDCSWLGGCSRLPQRRVSNRGPVSSRARHLADEMHGFMLSVSRC